jgi:hypothetical protein
MWKLELPPAGNLNLQLDAALTHLDGFATYELTEQERQALQTVYDAYDTLAGEPDATLNPTELDSCAQAIHDAYSQVQIGGRLETMRSRLLNVAIECPYCGAAPATTLDHHLPKAQYRSLSINPRNLIPSCQPCNRAKGTLQPQPDVGIIHAYFEDLPDDTFLVADANYAGGVLSISFVVDVSKAPAPLCDRLSFQIERLKLDDRLVKSINIFMFALKPGLELLRGIPGSRSSIQTHLRMAASSFDLCFGKNHWKSAVVRALADCDPFLDDPWSYLDNALIKASAQNATEASAVLL